MMELFCGKKFLTDRKGLRSYRCYPVIHFGVNLTLDKLCCPISFDIINTEKDNGVNQLLSYTSLVCRLANILFR